MSWIQKLVETYDACLGRPQFAQNPLAPISTVPQTTQLHIQLTLDGSFHYASLVEDRDTSLFVSEDSATRSGKCPAPNPLTEQLEYCAKGSERYGGKPDKYDRYVTQLKLWSESPYGDPKVTGVLKYVENGTMLDDLLNRKVLSESGGVLQKVKVGKHNAQDPLKLWVRWSIIGARQAETWSDAALMEKWRRFEATQSSERQFCMASGVNTRTTLQLTPYIAQLRSSRAAALQRRQSIIDAVYTLFETSSGESTFLDPRPLSGEFLLGFHSQREALKPRRDNSNDAERETMPEEGDNQ